MYPSQYPIFVPYLPYVRRPSAILLLMPMLVLIKEQKESNLLVDPYLVTRKELNIYDSSELPIATLTCFPKLASPGANKRNFSIYSTYAYLTNPSLIYCIPH